MENENPVSLVRERDVKIQKLRVRNFQSLKDITLTFDSTGVYHLYGVNNIGKSALLKAMDALFRNVSNQKYTKYIRDDCDTFIVEMWFHDGNYIKLSRGVTDYYAWTIDGVKGRMDKTKGKVPSVISNYLNLYIDYEKTKECLNIRLARNKLLFVDTSAGDNYYLQQKALGTEEFLLAMKLGSSKKRDTNKEIEIYNKYLEQEQTNLEEAKSDLDVYVSILDDVQKLENTLEQDYDLFCDIEDLVLSYTTYVNTEKELEELSERLKIKELKGLKKEYKKYEIIEQVYRSLVTVTKTKKELKSLKGSIVSMDEVKELEQEIQKLTLLEKATNAYEKLEETEESLEELKAQMVDAKELEELSSDIDQISAIGDTLVSIQKVLKTKKELKDYAIEETKTGLSNLEEELDKLSYIESALTGYNKYEKAKEEKEEALAEYIEADKEFTEFMRENNYCPIVAKTKDHKCPFDKEFFMEVLK